MPTEKNPVHMYVDEMTIHNGPSKEALMLLPEVNYANWRQRRVRVTLSTAASQRTMVTKVILTEVEIEYEDFFAAIDAGRNPFEDGTKPTGKFKLRGFMGKWYFTGIYDPHTRKGTLTEEEYDPENEYRE